MSDAPLPILEVLRSKMTQDQSAGSFFAAVEGRIATGQGAQDTPLPNCLVKLGEGVPFNRAFGGTTHNWNVVFEIWGDRQLGITALASIEQKLFTLLDGVSLVVPGFDRALVLFQPPRQQISDDDDGYRLVDQASISGTDFS